MNNIQENQLGMFLKVRHFLTVNRDELINVVAAIEPEIEAFDNLVPQLLAKASLVQEDLTGVAEMKAGTRLQLEELTLKVARALWAHATLTGNPELARACDLKRSELTQATDAQLYLAADRIKTRSGPLVTELEAFTVTTANLTQLNSLLITFLTQSELPKIKIEARKWANEELQMLFDKINALLSDRMDVYMSLFEFAELTFFELYSSARSIDSNSGGNGTAYTGTVAAGALALVFTKPWDEDLVFSFTNNGDSELQFAFSDAETPLAGVLLTVPPGSSYIRSASDFGNASNNLRVKNTGTAEGSYRVKEF